MIYPLCSGSTHIALWVYDGSSWYRSPISPTVTLNEYHYAVGYAKYDGTNTTLGLFYDGQSMGEITDTFTPASGVDWFRIGYRWSYFFKGTIAHVRIYNRALSEREIRAHANYLLQKYIAHPPFI